MKLPLHWYIFVGSRRRRCARGWCGRSRRSFDLLWYHTLQEHVNLITLENTEWAGGCDPRFVGGCGPNNPDRSIVCVELFVLLERLAQSVKPMSNEIFQRS